jgi:serine protease SohB
VVSFLVTAFHHKRIVQQLLGNDVEILILLESPGGNVATYGYLASQLARLRSHRNTNSTNNTSSTTIEDGTSKVTGNGTKLTICCDTVAASGGYLMACQADWFMAAPFAVIGSIGVYKVGNNFREFLEKFGIRPLLISSGKYKTLWHEYANSPPTKEELQHLQSKEDATLDAFKREILSVRSTRIAANIERVATGEAWLGVDAIKLGLVDELKTSDEYVLLLFLLLLLDSLTVTFQNTYFCYYSNIHFFLLLLPWFHNFYSFFLISILT